MEIVPVPLGSSHWRPKGRPVRAPRCRRWDLCCLADAPARGKRRPLPNFRNGCDDARGVPLPLRPRRLIAVVLCVLAFPAAAQAAPKVSIFYYPWYGNPALDGGLGALDRTGRAHGRRRVELLPGARPVLELDPRIVRAQMREIAAAGVQEVVSSWWGWGSPEDLRLPLVIRERARGGPLGRRPSRAVPRPHDRQRSRPTSHHLRAAGDHALLRLPAVRPRGRRLARAPLRSSTGSSSSRRHRSPARRPRAGFDGDLHVRHPPVRRGQVPAALRPGAPRRPPVPALGRPGLRRQRATGDPRIKSRRDGKTYDSMWTAAIQSSADGVTITSYNEWHEGTQIEPARQRPRTSATSLPELRRRLRARTARRRSARTSTARRSGRSVRARRRTLDAWQL